MKRILSLVALLASCAQQPLFAQATQAQFDSLKAEVAFLKSIVGFDQWKAAAIPCASLDSVRPKEFANGEYNLAFRNRQFGCAFDPVAKKAYQVDSVSVRFEGVVVRLGIAETKLSQLASTPSASTPPLSEADVRAIAADEISKRPAVVSSSAYPDLIDQGNGELIYVGKDTGGQRQSDKRGDLRAIFGINNYDGGSRVLVNWGCFNSLFPESTWGVDSGGAFSYNGAPCPRGTWSADRTYGQAFVIDGGWSQAGYDYASGAQYKPSILLASQRGGMDILFAVTPWRTVGQPVLNKVAMRIRSDGSANPLDAVIDGQLRTLKSCDVGGQKVVCF